MLYIANVNSIQAPIKRNIMKKTLAVLALALFIGGISVPAIASNYDAPAVMELRDEDPKKKAEEKRRGYCCTH